MVIKITFNGRIIQMLVYALLVMSALSAPAAAQYAWNGFQLNGGASNPVWAYNGTVATGSVNNGVQNL